MTQISDWRRRKERYRLLGFKCKECGSIYYPKRVRCVKCGSNDLEAIELPRRGKVLEYTVVRLLPERYSGFHPYIIALIELENGLKIFGQLTDIDLDDVSEGITVEATLRKLYEYGADGKIIYGIKFRPIVEK